MQTNLKSVELPQAEKREAIYVKLQTMAGEQLVEPNTVIATGVFSNAHDGEYGRTYYIDGVGDMSDKSYGLRDWPNLSRLMEKANDGEPIVAGQAVEVTYLGKSTFTNKEGKTLSAHDFDVKIGDTPAQA